MYVYVRSTREPNHDTPITVRLIPHNEEEGVVDGCLGQREDVNALDDLLK